jgi:hypothetical protein
MMTLKVPLFLITLKLHHHVVVEPVFQSNINTYMKKILTQYLWIFLIVLILAFISISLFPDKKNRLEFIEEEMKKVETKQKILTEKEKQLEKLATEKDWEEVDKDSNK